jgi:hypothetical protein
MEQGGSTISAAETRAGDVVNSPIGARRERVVFEPKELPAYPGLEEVPDG